MTVWNIKHTSVKVTAIINAAGTCVMGFASHDYKRDYKGSFLEKRFFYSKKEMGE